MTRRIHTFAAATAVALCALAPMAPSASAAPREDSKITARFNNNFALVGQVKSVPACERSRRVTLIRDSPMTGRSVVDRTRTERSGRYSFGQLLFEIGADYFVKAEKRNRSRVICKAAKAPVRFEE